MSKSNNNCSVVGCANTHKKSPVGTRFYSFPSEARFPGRKQLWINAVKRTKDMSGSPWAPSKNALICSMHFIGNIKSDHPHHPAYVPSIFPKIYKKRSGLDPMKKLQRFGRATRRQEIHNLHEGTLIDSEANTDETTISATSELQTKNAGTNCCFPENSYTADSISVLFCSLDGFNSEIQTNIYQKQVNTTSACIQTENDSDTVNDSKYEKEVLGFQGMDSISEDEKLKVMADVDFNVFKIFLKFVEVSLKGKSFKISLADRLLFFLMKLKLGICFSSLGIIFGIHRTTASRIFSEILDIIFTNTHNWIFWPSRSLVKSTMPQVFKENFSNCRAIIDCTEIKTERPTTVEQQVLFWSNYKSAFTLKFLIAITPGGLISLVSSCYSGRTSDGYITNDCGLLDVIEQGDLLLADKGFPGISAELSDQNVLLVMPPFSTGEQFSKEDIDWTYKIASVRIHVERIIQRVKIYEILNKIDIEQLPFIDKIVRICCVLANMQNPIIKQ